MLVIPAIDLLDGRCVRLHQGKYDDETVYFDDPVKMAKLWRIQNARTLHLVDLNAARGDAQNNRKIIGHICEALDIPVQVGGGIRTLDDVEAMLKKGVYRVILGTAAVRNPDLVSQALEKFGNCRVAVGIDAKNGEVRVQGWTEGSGLDAVELAVDMEARGCRRVIYTDISRDGTLQGPNLNAYRTLGKHLKRMRITASGGVSGFQDLIALNSLKAVHVDSVIVGKAFYEGIFPCQQFWCWNNKDQLNLDKYSSAKLRAPVADC